MEQLTCFFSPKTRNPLIPQIVSNTDRLCCHRISVLVFVHALHVDYAGLYQSLYEHTRVKYLRSGSYYRVVVTNSFLVKIVQNLLKSVKTELWVSSNTNCHTYVRHRDSFASTTNCILGYYTVSQKTSHLWLAITLTHMNGFWYFLAEMLPTK